MLAMNSKIFRLFLCITVIFYCSCSKDTNCNISDNTEYYLTDFEVSLNDGKAQKINAQSAVMVLSSDELRVCLKLVNGYKVNMIVYGVKARCSSGSLLIEKDSYTTSVSLGVDSDMSCYQVNGSLVYNKNCNSFCGCLSISGESIGEHISMNIKTISDDAGLFESCPCVVEDAYNILYREYLCNETEESVKVCVEGFSGEPCCFTIQSGETTCINNSAASVQDLPSVIISYRDDCAFGLSEICSLDKEQIIHSDWVESNEWGECRVVERIYITSKFSRRPSPSQACLRRE